ncbi:MAG: TetR/AcrR family transcriptional regulator [Gammaproteobacteria bacterium]|jgi:TetR/AcrR family transcriptional regulator
MNAKGNRKQQILEVLAFELETKPGSRITTASLARAVGVSEAALYRHFASKAQMFESLIEFSEESIFRLVNRILEEQSAIDTQCFQITTVVLKFAELNPGIARILAGEVLLGENERLRVRVAQIFARLETQLSDSLRRAAAFSGSQKMRLEVPSIANLLVAIVSGRIAQFVRTDFRISPSVHWEDQWQMLARSAFEVVPPT